MCGGGVGQAGLHCEEHLGRPRAAQPEDSKTLDEAQDKLGKVQQVVRSGIPVPDKVWKLGPYLDYWLENFVKCNRRPAAYNLYAMIVRLYLKPGLGSRKLTSLTVPAAGPSHRRDRHGRI